LGDVGLVAGELRRRPLDRTDKLRTKQLASKARQGQRDRLQGKAMDAPPLPKQIVEAYRQLEREA